MSETQQPQHEQAIREAIAVAREVMKRRKKPDFDMEDVIWAYRCRIANLLDDNESWDAEVLTSLMVKLHSAKDQLHPPLPVRRKSAKAE